MTLSKTFDKINWWLERYTYVVFAAGVGLIVATMVFRVPPAVMDVLIAINLAVSCLLLFSALGVSRIVQLSAFPSVLLLTTLLRLALNVSTTRLILLEADAGEIIFKFGNLVVGGNFVVGLAVFLVLTIIQFMVISKGVERAAEVSARFTSDGIQSRLTGIETDLAAGRITKEQALQRRAEANTEKDMSAAMVAAAKFINGDAIAGLIIVAVNIVGGLVVGVLQNGMQVVDAAKLYSVLTIGDGLVSQIPALIIGLSAAIIITRVSRQDSDEPSPGGAAGLGRDVLLQSLAQPHAFHIVAGVLLVLALAIGPWYVFIALAALAAGVGVYAQRRRDDAIVIDNERRAATGGGSTPAPMSMGGPLSLPAPVPAVRKRSSADPILIQYSKTLESMFCQPDAAGVLADRLNRLLNRCYEEWGFLFPDIKMVRNNDPRWPANAYGISHLTVTRFTRVVPTNGLLCNLSAAALEAKGIPAEPLNPGTDRPCVVDLSHRDKAKAAGCELLDMADLLERDLQEFLKRNAAEFCGVSAIADRVEALRETDGDLVACVLENRFSIADVAEVCARLVRENIPVAALRVVLEGMARWRGKVSDMVPVTEHVRRHMRVVISGRFGVGNKIFFLSLDQDAHEAIDKALRPDAPNGPTVSLGVDTETALRRNIDNAVERAQKRTVLLVAPALRHPTHLALEGVSQIPVLTRDEIAPGYELRPVGTVGIDAEVSATN